MCVSVSCGSLSLRPHELMVFEGESPWISKPCLWSQAHLGISSIFAEIFGKFSKIQKSLLFLREIFTTPQWPPPCVNHRFHALETPPHAPESTFQYVFFFFRLGKMFFWDSKISTFWKFPEGQVDHFGKKPEPHFFRLRTLRMIMSVQVYSRRKISDQVPGIASKHHVSDNV